MCLFVKCKVPTDLLSGYPTLTALVERFYALPEIVAYYADKA